jgi:hypothetical protein
MFAWDGYSGTSFEVKIREMEKRFEEALIWKLHLSLDKSFLRKKMMNLEDFGTLKWYLEGLALVEGAI